MYAATSLCHLVGMMGCVCSIEGMGHRVYVFLRYKAPHAQLGIQKDLCTKRIRREKTGKSVEDGEDDGARERGETKEEA